MLIAGTVDLAGALAALAVRRPVFHSEADFQFSLAWQVQQADPAMQVYLETRPAEGVHLDLAFERPDLGRYTAVELKYLTRAWTGQLDGQTYSLKNHSAHDLRRYDVVKDIARVEKFIAASAELRPDVEADGAVIVLSNDPAYARAGRASTAANDTAFRIGDGAILGGDHKWLREVAGRPDLVIRGRYEVIWSVYSERADHTLRQLVIEVPAAS